MNVERAIKRIDGLGGTAVVEPGFCTVSLSSSEVTDEDLKLFVDLPEVEILSLSDTAVSDAGLPHLYRLTKLELLTLSGTNVTASGVDGLAKALPNTKITTEPPPRDSVNPFTGEPFE